MWNQIVSELQQILEDHVKRFAYGVEAIFADSKRQEQERGRTYIALPVKRRITERATPAPG